jgi:AcrR family transcriptional regulator
VSDERRLDDAALMRLLWRGGERPSARSGLTTSRIVTAGIELADADGALGPLSMRRVADHLGVGTMSLYTYVPGKRELVLLMLDQVHGELPDHVDGEGWRERLTVMADQHWELYQRHPWLHDVPITRSGIGPNVMERYELELGIVDGLGLDELEMDGVIELIQTHVGSASERLRGIRADTDESGMSDDEWWYAVLPTLTQVLADRDYPLSARVGSAVGAPHLDTRYLLRFGLERIFDGLETLINARAGGGSVDPRA